MLSWAVLEALWAILAALVALLGRLGSFEEPQDGVMAAQGPPKVGPIHAALRVPEGGWPLRRLQKPYQDTTWHSSTLQRAKGTVADPHPPLSGTLVGIIEMVASAMVVTAVCPRC